MYKIAIVDDDNDSRDFIRRMLIRYGAEKNTEFVVDGYENAVDFIEKYKAGYDLIFMDIMMPYMDGMTAAAKLREMDKNVLLVFITNMAQYAAQGYDVDAFGFLIKPVTYESIALKMAKAMERLESETSGSVVIGSKTTFRKVRISDIKYVEIRGHTLVWHTTGGNFTNTGTLKQVQKQLGTNFALCNQCYLVNLARCDRLDKTEVVVSGETLQISRYKKAEFLRQLNRYLNNMP